MKKCTLLGLRSLIGGILILALSAVNAQNNIPTNSEIEDTTNLILSVAFSDSANSSLGAKKKSKKKKNVKEPEIPVKKIVDDAEVPDSAGGGMKIQIEAGIRKNDFHMTFEKTYKQDNGVLYVYFDGEKWGKPIQVTKDAPYRRGVSMAVDKKNDVHFVWGTERRNIKYRSLIGGKMKTEMIVVKKARQAESDIAVDASGNPHIVAHSKTTKHMAVYTKKSSRQWSAEELPDKKPKKRWAPTICISPGGKIFVACRSEEGGHPTLWLIKEKGEWSEEHTETTHKYEPNSLFTDEDVHFVAHNNVGFQYYHISSKALNDYDVFSNKIRINHKNARGQMLGFAVTENKKIFICHSSLKGGEPNAMGRDISKKHNYFYSVSADGGKTWQTDCKVTEDSSGQGHGDVASNGNKVMLVWPDMRNGLHLRYSIFDVSE